MQSHSSIQKAGMVAGTCVRLLPTRAEDNYALRPAVLEAAIEEDIAAGLLPFYVVATIGTTSSCAVDPVLDMGRISQKHNLWYAICHPWSHIWLQTLYIDLRIQQGFGASGCLYTAGSHYQASSQGL